MKHRQAKKNAKKLAKNLRVAYRFMDVNKLRGMPEPGHEVIIDDSWGGPPTKPRNYYQEALDEVIAAEDAHVQGILDKIAASTEDPAKKVQFPSPNIRRVQFPEPYAGPLYNPPIEEMAPLIGKSHDDAVALHKKLHPETWVTMKDGKEIHRVTIENPGPHLPLTKWIAENQPMTAGVEPSLTMAEVASETLQMALNRGTLMAMTAPDLRALAREKTVKGVSAMSKSQLIDAIMAKVGGV